MGDRLRILVLAPFPPRLDGRHGGSRSIAHLTRQLAKRNRVALAYLRAADEPPADPALVTSCELVCEARRPGMSSSSIRPWYRIPALLGQMADGRPLWVAARWDRRFAQRVRAIAAEWDPHIVQAEFSAMGQYLGVAEARRARTVLTVHEPGAAAALERAEGSGALPAIGWRVAATLWRRYERAMLRSVDATVVFTERDRGAMSALAPEAFIERIPLGTAVPQRASNALGEAPPSLLFIGNFIHRPNVEAARWLVEHLLPRLRHHFPSLQLMLVGANPPEPLRRAAGAGVIVIGEVPDIAPYLDRAAIVLCPLTSGGGMRVKVLEAMAAGKAIVASPLAVEGLEVEAGEHLLIADGEADYVAHVRMVLSDPTERQRLAAAARAWVTENFTWDQAAMSYEALYERIRERSPRAPVSTEAG